VAQVPATRPKPRPERPVRQARPAPPKQPEARPSQRTTERQSAQRAAGTGGGKEAGRAGSSSASLSPAQVNNLKATWGNKVRARIERRKPRPPRGKNGTATLRIAITGDGRLAGASLARSSGVPEIDQAAVQAVRRTGRFPKAPAQLGPGPHNFTLSIAFR